MDKDQVSKLLNKYNNGNATVQEKALLESWYINHQNENPVKLTSEEITRDLADVYTSLPKRKQVMRLWVRLTAAAAIVVFISTGIIFLRPKQLSQNVVQIQLIKIMPGSNQATLTLANGQKIILTRALSGNLAQQGNATIKVKSGDAIAYVAHQTVDQSNQKVGYNILSTKIGEQSPFPLILADGTKIWLNAKSSITFPTVFTGKERSVTIEGEAYFEVAKDVAHPFIVKSAGQEIRVLGTHFNVNSYREEPVVKTTLLEGSIRITAGNHEQIISPGEQAVFSPSKLIVRKVDVEESVAWKNGYFLFEDEAIESIMRKLARWYAVDVVYVGPIPQTGFQGEVSKFREISQVLNVLEDTKAVHFKREGRKIIVSK